MVTAIIFFLSAIINGMIGNYYIQKGIKTLGKQEYLDSNGGYLYVGYVIITTIFLIVLGIINI